MITTNNLNLSSILLFRDLSKGDLDKIAEQCTVRRFRQNEQVIDRHSTDCDLYLIVKGSARVVNYSLSGREVSFDDREEGDYFGELSALDSKPRSANIIALEDMVVACLPQKSFNRLLIKHPQITLHILGGLVRIVRTSNNRIMDLTTVGANNRVHAEILRLARRHIRGDNTASISPLPIHSDIASRVSTTRETVNRAFSDLTRRGILKKHKNTLIISDLSGLTKMVEQVRGESD